MRGGRESRRKEAARDILNYLLRHPAAADTYDGITRWRILEEMARRNIASTETAMRWLVAQGLLREEKIAGGQILYRLNAGKMREAEHLVMERGEDLPGAFRQSSKH